MIFSQREWLHHHKTSYNLVLLSPDQFWVPEALDLGTLLVCASYFWGSLFYLTSVDSLFSVVDLSPYYTTSLTYMFLGDSTLLILILLF